MPCARCGVSVEDHLPGKTDHAFVDDDPDADIKLEGSPRPAVPPEVCFVCQSPDGRAIETLLLNRHLCAECSQSLFDLAVALRLRLSLFAVDCMYKTGFAERIVKTLR